MQHDFILLDRSQSMTRRWEEALGSVNSYVHKLANENVDTGVTLAVFDQDIGELDFKVIRDRIVPSTWSPVTSQDATPRGNTPLNDAIGRLVALAEKGHNGHQYDKAAIIIMTDGEENASRELDFQAAKKLLDRCRGRNWQVIFLGVDYDNAQQARTYGAQAGQTLSASAANLAEAMQSTAEKRSTYAATGQPINYTDQEKQQAQQQQRSRETTQR